MPAVTVVVAPADTFGIEVDAPRAVRTVRTVRTERRRPVTAVGTGIAEIRVVPATGGGKEDTVPIGFTLYQSTVYPVLSGPGPVALVHERIPLFIRRHTPLPVELNVGDIIKADVFAAGEKVDVCGTGKGKGYAGAIKRWNFGRLKETHGSGPVVRHQGSMGACSDPSRVFKGKKMAGHLGSERVTIQNLDVVKVDAENNLIAVKGAVPGVRGGIVVITDAVKKA